MTRVNPVKKWTVRVDDETAEAFTAFCAQHGVSVHSCLSTMVTATVTLSIEHGNQPVEEWEATAAERFGRMIESARQLDAERRRRS